MSKGTFGDNLKREREMRGVTLDEISAATRIATRFLQAIENEDWTQLPGGVFNRGFVRAVARYLGLDEENIVAEYIFGRRRSSQRPGLDRQPSGGHARTTLARVVYRRGGFDRTSNRRLVWCASVACLASRETRGRAGDCHDNRSLRI